MNFRSHIPNDWQTRLVIAVLALAPFSFAPSVALPFRGFVSFRLGLYQLLVALFVVSGLWLQRRLLQQQLMANRWLQLVGAGLVLILINSLAVTQDLQRTLLLSASVLLLSGATLAMYLFVAQLSSQKREQFFSDLKFWVVTVGAGVSIVGIGQFILGSIDQSFIADGLCRGCQAVVFGFPRINVFAAEPQFFASAMLPALFISLTTVRRGRVLGAGGWVTTLLITVAFALSFSRGANLALVAGLLVLGWLLVKNQRLKQYIRIIAVVVSGFLIASTIIITNNYLQYRSQNQQIVAETFETLVEHGSNGLVELDIRDNTKGDQNNPAPSTDLQTPARKRFTPPQQIEASADERLEAARAGLSLLDSPRRLLLGVGLGNLGPQALADGLSVPANLTIYIQYALVLAETGVIGLILFTGLHLAAASVVWRLYKKSPTTGLWLVATSIAFMVQYLFFGTYINTVYIWLYLGLSLAASKTLTTDERMLEWKP